LPIKPSFLLAVCHAVGTSEKYASNMPEGHWVSGGMSMMKHWLHPYLVVVRPSNSPASEHSDQSLRIRSQAASRCCRVVLPEELLGPWRRMIRPSANLFWRATMPLYLKVFPRRIGAAAWRQLMFR
jgi:hypothetical protein